mmetsp:Transcript_69244/g.225551  ORF Transcript_69244/g.225551 Transcript_69244/m.225551 type:complete len:314 (-) Transcript_69244:184-1125(-)
MACSKVCQRSSGARWAMRLAVAAALLAEPTSAAVASKGVTGGTGKTLEPKDHFWKKDYPDDQQPAPPEEEPFDHPFPTVQDSEDWDKDFVEDTNSDNGEYKNQARYDELRHRIGPLRDAVLADREKLIKTAEEVENDQKMLKSLEQQEREEAAKEHVAEIHRKKFEEEGEQEMKKAMDQEEQIAKEQAELDKIKKTQAEAEEEARQAGDAEKSSNKNIAEKKKAQEETTDDLNRSINEHEALVKEAETKEQELKRLQKEFEKAQGMLRKYRREEDMEGGVYPKHPPKKSGASSSAPWLLTSMAAALAALLGSR